MNRYIINMACNDQPNLVKNTCQFISDRFGNIIEMEQHVDQTEAMFFLRVSWETKEQQSTQEL